MQGRSRILARHGDIESRLTWYPPGLHMARHAHDHHQVSWLLAGELLESDRARDCEVLRPSVGLKPAGFAHANTYGRHGALILSVNVRTTADTTRFGLAFDDWCWSAPVGLFPASLALARLTAAGQADAQDALGDLLALSTPAGETTTNSPPGWLAHVRERLAEPGEESDLETLAREAGVHRVHLSRTFTRCVGLPPSLYRRRCRLARAVESLAAGFTPAMAATTAGFADQAHLTRTARAAIGLSPGRLGRLLLAA